MRFPFAKRDRKGSPVGEQHSPTPGAWRVRRTDDAQREPALGPLPEVCLYKIEHLFSLHRSFRPGRRWSARWLPSSPSYARSATSRAAVLWNGSISTLFARFRHSQYARPLTSSFPSTLVEFEAQNITSLVLCVLAMVCIIAGKNELPSNCPRWAPPRLSMMSSKYL
jgi:hypothetical protein